MGIYRKVIKIILLELIMGIITAPHVYASESDSYLTVILDPGHGGEENGAEYFGKKEKDINLKIAEYVKAGLEQYDNVKVVLTRDGDYAVGLKERADIASDSQGDIFISIHCNASVSHIKHGASVYISTGEGKRRELMDFADYFLGEFEAIGLANAGTFARVTQMGRMRSDGSFDDYYGVLRHSYNNGIPGLIVEHCCMDCLDDLKYIRNEEGIRRLAKADINAICAYYRLKSREGDVYDGKHAGQYGATTEAVRHNYYAPPKLNSIKLKEFDDTSKASALFYVDIEDGVGIDSIYLVYKTGIGDSITIPLVFEDELRTGVYELKGYIPDNIESQYLSLQYVGIYDIVGFDAGYNYYNNKLVGFGKCDWLNSFDYSGEADIDMGAFSYDR